jgi:hypothetical protein
VIGDLYLDPRDLEHLPADFSYYRRIRKVISAPFATHRPVHDLFVWDTTSKMRAWCARLLSLASPSRTCLRAPIGARLARTDRV